jgi:hypothetical protein
MKTLNNNNVKNRILFTVGAINNTLEIMFECNEQDNYKNFMNRLCCNIMDNVDWAPFKQYIAHNNILWANDILLYFVPPGCNIDYIILLADPSLPYDLDYALPRLEWYMNPCITIQQIISFMDNWCILVTPGKRIPWLRNSMEILEIMYNLKGYEELSIMRLSAMAADYLDEFAVNRIDAQFPPMVVQPLKFSNVDIYDLNDVKFISSVENAVHSIVTKQSLH